MKLRTGWEQAYGSPDRTQLENRWMSTVSESLRSFFLQRRDAGEGRDRDADLFADVLKDLHTVTHSLLPWCCREIMIPGFWRDKMKPESRSLTMSEKSPDFIS